MAKLRSLGGSVVLLAVVLALLQRHGYLDAAVHSAQRLVPGRLLTVLHPEPSSPATFTPCNCAVRAGSGRCEDCMLDSRLHVVHSSVHDAIKGLWWRTVQRHEARRQGCSDPVSMLPAGLDIP